MRVCERDKPRRAEKKRKKKKDEQIKKTGPARCSGPEITAPAVWILHNSVTKTRTVRRRTETRKRERGENLFFAGE